MTYFMARLCPTPWAVNGSCSTNARPRAAHCYVSMHLDSRSTRETPGHIRDSSSLTQRGELVASIRARRDGHDRGLLASPLPVDKCFC